MLNELPRSLFLPDVIWPLDPDTGVYRAVDRRQDPREWERWARADAAIVTQWDDGAHTGPEPGVVPTSSASMPTIVAQMLDDLDAGPGQRVLDVGAGTGWTTALLATRAGADRVVGVEVDPRVAQAAREHAATAGPLIVTGDGDKGWPDGGPYDRVQATFAIRRVPAAWIEQSRTGGLIVAPWGTPYSNINAVTRLKVGSGGTASGRFTRLVEFMLDRTQRDVWHGHEPYLPGGSWPDDARESETSVQVDAMGGVAEFVIGLRVQHVMHTIDTGADGTTTLMLYSLDDLSWAAAFFRDDGSPDSLVYQGGDRNLWDEVEAAYRWWTGAGSPDVTRFGLSVSPDGSHGVWLDSTRHAVSART
jgi:protein-L-isoaspartate O-methyltransferase